MNLQADRVRPKRRPWGFVLTCGVVVLLALLVLNFRIQVLTGLANYLVIQEELQPADIIFVLNGDFNTRPFYASDLYQQGLAPRLAIARCEDVPAVALGLLSNDTDISVDVMEELGVPSASIIVLPFPGGVTSTYDEATVLRDYIETHAIQRVILVTSAFHTRRAGWIFSRELAGLPVTLELAAAPDTDYDATNWWKSENGLITLNNEYIKLLYYLFKYH